MLHCNLCNYYKTGNSRVQSSAKCMCELTGFVFHNKPEEYNLEKYPCFDYEIKTKAVSTEALKESFSANFNVKKPA